MQVLSLRTEKEFPYHARISMLSGSQPSENYLKPEQGHERMDEGKVVQQVSKGHLVALNHSITNEAVANSHKSYPD